MRSTAGLERTFIAYPDDLDIRSVKGYFPGMAMTPKQERFCLEYLVDLNATQAAIRAGYSEDTARSIGSENLSKPDIVERIAQLQAERSARTKIDADWLLRRLADESMADIADLYDEDGNIKPVHEWPMIWRIGLVQGMDVEERYEGRDENRERVVTRKIKISDRAKRLELIGRHVSVGAFRDNISVSGEIAVTISPTDGEL